MKRGMFHKSYKKHNNWNNLLQFLTVEKNNIALAIISQLFETLTFLWPIVQRLNSKNIFNNSKNFSKIEKLDTIKNNNVSSNTTAYNSFSDMLSYDEWQNLEQENILKCTLI